MVNIVVSAGEFDCAQHSLISAIAVQVTKRGFSRGATQEDPCRGPKSSLAAPEPVVKVASAYASCERAALCWGLTYWGKYAGSGGAYGSGLCAGPVASQALNRPISRAHAIGR